jgi:hypothetical protein
VNSLALDPADGSIWVGHAGRGITRLVGGGQQIWSFQAFGAMAGNPIPDIQADQSVSPRRMLVGFQGTAAWPASIGVYTGN